MPVPTEPGYYWAKQMRAEEGQKASRTWEPVELYDTADGTNLWNVYVAGSPLPFEPEDFHWGDKLTPPVDRTREIRDWVEEDERIKIIAEYRRMTLAERVERSQVRRKSNTNQKEKSDVERA